MSVDSGTVIGGRYQLVDRRGEGGVGVVWRAIDGKTQATVAVKVLGAQHLGGGEGDVAARFRRLARTLHKFDHPGVVRILDVHAESEEGPPYLVMEWLEGLSWKERRTTRGPANLADELGILFRVASVLASLHDAGVAHRDVKPDNVFLHRCRGRDGMIRVEVKLIDFDLLMERQDGRTRMTSDPSALGTVDYMAPEQFEGATIDTRVDVWALGVMLYEILAGRRPFGGRVEFEVAANILRERVPPLPDGLHVPDEVRDLVSRCLSKDPAQRPKTAGFVRDALETVGKKHPSAVAAYVFDNLPDSREVHSAEQDYVGVTRLGSMWWNRDQGTRSQSAVTKPMASAPASRAPWVFAGVISVVAIGVTVMSFVRASASDLPSRWRILSNVAGADIVVGGMKVGTVARSDQGTVVDVGEGTGRRSVELRCGSTVVQQAVLDYSDPTVMPVVLQLDEAAASSCGSPPFVPTTRAPAVASAPVEVDAGVSVAPDAGPPWMACVGTWSGGDADCRNTFRLFETPDSNGRIGRYTSCGDSYSGRLSSLTPQGSDWRLRVSSEYGWYTIQLTCTGAESDRVRAISSDGAVFSMRRSNP